MRKVLFLSMPVNRMHYILRFCFVFLFICLTGFLHAQELRYQFKNYTPSDGLPSSEVHKVLQDFRHYMWFATDHGICRYNGYRFETFNLPDNSILGLFEDYKKRIWAWSFSGQLFFFENGKFEEYKWNSKIVNAIKPGVINAIYLDSSDALYVSSTGPNSYVISKDGVMRDLVLIESKIQYKAFPTIGTSFFTFVSSYPRRFNTGEALPTLNTSIAVRFAGKEVKITIPYHYKPERFRVRQFSKERVLFFSNEFFIWIYANASYDLQKPGFRIYDVEEINGLFYLATEKGVIIQNKKGEVVAEYFTNKHITSIAKDYEGGLWFTSLLDGVYYLNSTYTMHLAKSGVISNRKINVLHNLADTGVLAGTFDGHVLRILPGFVWDEVKMYVKPIFDFCRQDDSTFFVGGGELGPKSRWFVKIEGKPIAYIQTPCLSNMLVLNNVLYSGINDNVFRADLRDTAESKQIGKESFRVSKIFSNHKKELLIGNLFGLWKYDGRRLYRYDSTKPILQSRITDIAEYKDQLLLLGTRGKGLLINGNDSLIRLTETEGLVSNNIRKIFIDSNLIWLATNRGISLLTVLSLKPFRYKVKNINVQDGLLSNEINDIIRSGQKIVVATNSGISYLDRGYFVLKQTDKLPFYVTGIRLNGLFVDSSTLNSLGFKNRNLSVTYEALKYTNPGSVSYRYRLSGYDTTWFYTNDLQLQFNPMPYGNYVLQIQAMSELGDWDISPNLISLPIVCKPPFWATTWFWVAAFSLLMFLVILLFRKRINDIRLRQKQQEDLKQKINDTEQMALKAQMNPHFIFNSLNSIQQYVIDSDVKGANEFISGFSKLIRQTLEFSSKELITLEEEISYLSTYLDLEKARMESGFTYNVNVQTQHPVSQLELPPLLLQPYVENALRHGVRYLKHADGVILLTFMEYPGLLECIIEDNGIGRAKAKELKAVNPIEYQSRGMSLTAERITLLNEGQERKIEVIIEDLKDHEGKASGTKIRVLFPA
jgi:hypothetical protein